MKLYPSDRGTIEGRDLYLAEQCAGMYLTNETRNTRGTWSFNGYGGDIRSNRRPNERQRSGEHAATWDQWGVLLSLLFERDPSMKVGSRKHPHYDGADDFHHKTGGRFREVRSVSDLPDFHGDHRFQFDPGLGGFAVLVHRCTKCSAVRVDC